MGLCWDLVWLGVCSRGSNTCRVWAWLQDSVCPGICWASLWVLVGLGSYAGIQWCMGCGERSVSVCVTPRALLWVHQHLFFGKRFLDLQHITVTWAVLGHARARPPQEGLGARETSPLPRAEGSTGGVWQTGHVMLCARVFLVGRGGAQMVT